MLTDINRLSAVAQGGAAAATRLAPLPAIVAPASDPHVTAVPAPGPSGRTVEPRQALAHATRLAAHAMFENRDVEVTSFHDPASGRIVCKVEDRNSGELLMQSPPDALLRFFASTRRALSEPLLALDA